ncbi:DedA family protein [Pseudonocardia sp. NPDC049635]|uniref:DedA family protein n=1 Tax=Pseudonocardia sp. NPDC049635 TaxID=3155506 RepID=UPI0033FAC5AE
MTDWVFSVIDALGAVGVGLLIFLDNIIPPIPSEAILPLAGYRAAQGAFSAVSLWLGATVGAVAGAYVLYGLGAWLGYERLHELAGKRWFVLSSQKDLERGRDLFDRFGNAFVLGSRCIPLLRSVVSLPAGVARMPLVRFTVLTTIGSAIWNALLIGLGWQLGENWHVVDQALGPVSYAVAALALALVVVLVVRKLRARRALATVGEPVTRPIPRVRR